MEINRYDPGAYGAMNESEDGKYYHKRDVDELIGFASGLLKELRDPKKNLSFNDEIEYLKKWGVK